MLFLVFSLLILFEFNYFYLFTPRNKEISLALTRNVLLN